MLINSCGVVDQQCTIQLKQTRDMTRQAEKKDVRFRSRVIRDVEEDALSIEADVQRRENSQRQSCFLCQEIAHVFNAIVFWFCSPVLQASCSMHSAWSNWGWRSLFLQTT